MSEPEPQKLLFKKERERSIVEKKKEKKKSNVKHFIWKEIKGQKRARTEYIHRFCYAGLNVTSEAYLK